MFIVVFVPQTGSQPVGFLLLVARSVLDLFFADLAWISDPKPVQNRPGRPRYRPEALLSNLFVVSAWDLRYPGHLGHLAKPLSRALIRKYT